MNLLQEMDPHFKSKEKLSLQVTVCHRYIIFYLHSRITTTLPKQRKKRYMQRDVNGLRLYINLVNMYQKTCPDLYTLELG